MRLYGVYHSLAVTQSRALAIVVLLVVVLSVLSSCAGLRSRSGWYGASLTRGFVQLEATSGKPQLQVSGSLLDMQAAADVDGQLRVLEGAFLAVHGSRSEGVLKVRSFEILEAPDGLAPMVGAVVVDQGGVMLEDELSGRRIGLRGQALAELKRQHAARIWVTGSVVGPQTLLVANWGLLSAMR
ncbi:MAG: hypothetical protein CMP23_06015 [Rickettsiales bacterium]|nr:hypothetical protein [Rickettsiales bacterium]